MDFSADTSILEIMHSYLQPFELAMITNIHTSATYNNAAEHGNDEYLTNYYVKGSYMDDALHNTVKYHHIDALKLLLKLGADNIAYAFSMAISYNHLDIIKLLMEIYNFDTDVLDDALPTAVFRGHLDAIILLIKLGAKDLDNAFRIATKVNNFDAMKLLVQLGAKDLNGAFSSAIYNNRLDTVKVLVELGANDFESAIDTVKRQRGNYYDLITYLEICYERVQDAIYEGDEIVNHFD